MALPLVLTHEDFAWANMLVDPETCHLLGVVDWAEAAIEPFGLNFFWVEETIMGWFDLTRGRALFPDHEVLYDAFWGTLGDECDGWTEEVANATRQTVVLGALRWAGFTSRLANEPEPVPISDNESGAEKLRHLDGLLINPDTKLDFLRG